MGIDIDYTKFITSVSCHQCEMGNHDSCLEKRNRLDKIFTTNKFHCYCFGSQQHLHNCKIEEIIENEKRIILVSNLHG